MSTEEKKDIEGAVEAPASQEAAPLSTEEESFKSQFMRVSADFANYKRRMEKERVQWMRTGQVAIIEAFLPVVDDVERALAATQAMQAENESEELLQAIEGFALVQKNMHKALTDLGVSEVSCDGPFDPHKHEALMQTASEDHESGQIVQVLNKGYEYKDAVIRHAKVSVAQ